MENPQRLDAPRMPYRQEMMSIIVGMLMGDASIVRKYPYNLVLGHTESQLDYFRWKGSILVSLGFEPRKERTQKIWNGSKAYIQDYYHRKVIWFYQKFYKNGKRRVNPLLIRHLTPYGLAIWFMDDGCQTRHGYDSFCLHTNAFSYEDHLIMQKWFKRKFGYDVRIHVEKKYYKLYFTSKSAKQFRNMVHPYIHPSMEYKLR